MSRFAGPSGLCRGGIGAEYGGVGEVRSKRGPPRARGPPSVSARPPEAYAPDSTQRSQSRALDPSRTHSRCMRVQRGPTNNSIFTILTIVVASKLVGTKHNGGG